MWTDSTTVLHWLISNDKLPVFLGNRVGKKLESTTIDKKHPVPSADNAADTSTKRMFAHPEKTSVIAEKD